jgi:RNA polymerase sigma factor (sigma-70 family)
VLSENDLVRKCKKGDETAQALLFNRYAAAMLGVCLRYARNKEEARDWLHDGFVKIFTHIASFKTESSLKTWMTSIFINTALSHLGKAIEQHRHIQIEEVDLADHVSEMNENELDNILYSLSQEEVLATVQELPEKYRLILNLYCVDGFTHRAIADKLGISEGTSKSQLSRARKLLINLILQKKVMYEKAS